MNNSIFLIFNIGINPSRSVGSVFIMGTVYFTAALHMPWAFSATDVSQKSEWSVCTPFSKAASKQRQITASALEREFENFTSPETVGVSKERAAYLTLSKNTLAPNRSSIEQWQWNSLKATTDKIYAGEITVKEFMVDINNNGSLEHVVEFRSRPPFTRAWNFILDENGRFHRDFFMRTGEPEAMIGELRVFNGETYIFDISNPVLNPRTGEFGSLPFVIYKPRTSAMMKNSGISRYGAGPLCEFEVIHEQEKVR